MKFMLYEPDQAWLLPPSVKDVLGANHLCFLVHEVVEKLDLSKFEKAYVEEGAPAYAPALMVKVWLYA
jgi:transposase